MKQTSAKYACGECSNIYVYRREYNIQDDELSSIIGDTSSIPQEIPWIVGHHWSLKLLRHLFQGRLWDETEIHKNITPRSKDWYK